MIQYLDVFDESIQNRTNRWEMIEVLAIAKVRYIQILQEAESITLFLQLFRMYGDANFLISEDTVVLNVIKALVELIENQEIQLILEVEGTLGYKYITQLSPPKLDRFNIIDNTGGSYIHW